MEVAWRVRFMLVVVLGLIFIGDLVGYQSVKGVKLAKRQSTFMESPQNGDIYEGEIFNEISSDVKDNKFAEKLKLTAAIREFCLPKMLCEMASKLKQDLTDKEQDILYLLQSTSMSLAINSPPSKWHFAAHMGQLLRYTDNSPSTGCANLWPQCPFSSKKLMGLTNKISV